METEDTREKTPITIELPPQALIVIDQLLTQAGDLTRDLLMEHLLAIGFAMAIGETEQALRVLACLQDHIAGNTILTDLKRLIAQIDSLMADDEPTGDDAA